MNISDYLAVKKSVANGTVDINTLSEEELDALIEVETENIITCETEADTSFLDMCLAAVSKYRNGDGTVSAEKCADIGKKAYNKYVSSQKVSVRAKFSRVSAKIAAVCAAVFVFGFVSISAAAVAFGSYSAAWEYVSKNVSSLIGLDSSYDVGNITVIKNGKKTKYSSIEEFFSKNDVDILYPSYLPDGVSIDSVIIKTEADTVTSCMFAFNDPSYSFSVDYDRYVDVDVFENYSVYEAGGETFYIIEVYGVYQATSVGSSPQYVLNCVDKNELLSILDALTRYNK